MYVRCTQSCLKAPALTIVHLVFRWSLGHVLITIQWATDAIALNDNTMLWDNHSLLLALSLFRIRTHCVHGLFSPFLNMLSDETITSGHQISEINAVKMHKGHKKRSFCGEKVSTIETIYEPPPARSTSHRTIRYLNRQPATKTYHYLLLMFTK